MLREILELIRDVHIAHPPAGSAVRDCQPENAVASLHPATGCFGYAKSAVDLRPPPAPELPKVREY